MSSINPLLQLHNLAVYFAAQQTITPQLRGEIIKYVNFISIGVGVVATLSVVIAGIQYMASQDNPQSVASAKERLVNAIFGLIIFVVMFAILQFLIPGGLFRTTP